MNAIVAGAIVAALGEGTIYAMEQVYLGKKTLEDVEWVKKFLESKLSQEFIDKVMDVVKKISSKGAKIDIKDVAQIIVDLFVSSKK